MNPQYQAQDMQQGIPVNLLRAQQQQQQLQLLQQQRLLQKQQRQMYNPQMLVGQNQQIPLQLQYQLQQQYQQQQLQRLQLLKQKQTQGLITGQETLDPTAFSNPLLYQQNQLLQQQQTQLLQQSPQQLPQSLLLDPTQTNIATSQQLLKSNSLVPSTVIGQSPTLSAKQTILQQQLTQQQKLKLINQSPVQAQGTLKSTTPQLPVQTKVPVSTTQTSSNSISVTTPSTQPPSLFNNPLSIVDFQSQLSSQPSLTSQIPTSAINLDQFTKNSILNIPTSTNALITTTATTTTNAFVSSALAVSSIPSLDSLSTTLPLSTTLALPTASTQAVTAQITSMSPLNKSQTSLQLSQAQLQSQLKQMKTGQKSPPSKAQSNVPTSTIATSTSSTATLQSLNQIKKSGKQTSPTAIAQSSLVNIPYNKMAPTKRMNSTTASSLPKTNTPTLTTTTSSATPTLAATEKPKPKRIPSTTINSITIPTPTSQMLNSTLSNTSLQNYQSLIQLQTPQQQKLNLTQLSNAQIKIPSQDTIKDELDQLTTSNDILLTGLTGKPTTNSLNSNTTKSKKSATTTPVETTAKKSNSLDQTSLGLKTPQTPTLNSAIKSETPLSNPLLNKNEPITHININYNGTGSDDINSVLYGKLSNNFDVNKTSADVSPLNPSYNSKTLVNPIYGQQPSSQNEKIISKGSYFLKCHQLFYVLRKEAKYREISFWKRFTSNYFSDKCLFKINILNIKFIELKRAIIPQYFDVLTKSEILSTNVSFGTIDERYPGDGSCNLEAKDSIMIYSYEGIQINWIGNIKVVFDKNGKVELYEFFVKDIKRYFENSPYMKSNYPILNEVGMPTTVKRFIEIYEVVNKMNDLINCSIAWNLGPKKTLSQYANQYRQELNSNSNGVNQQLNNLKLNRMGSVNSPVLSLSNNETLTNAQNYNTNTLLDSDIMPPPQAPSASNSAHSSNLNSTSDNVTNSLNKKRLANGSIATPLSPTNNAVNALSSGTNSITVSNGPLSLNPLNTSLASNVGLNLPTSSSVLSNLSATSAALSSAGINLNVSSATALSNAISAVNFNALSGANLNTTAAMSTMLSPLQMELTGTEPKAKKLKTSSSPRQRKNKTPTSRTVATKNRRNSSNNSSAVSS